MSAMEGLVHLDISGSTCVTDRSMESLAKHCPKSIIKLNVNFCPNITNQGLGYLVSMTGMQFASLGIWGCAQISDEFLDGHDRIESGGLDIVGAWMKQSGKRSIR
mmetsp:Transcript_19185/g.27000  ORF Transcript_19185/g.27000 Transcript_19185/m.27000 type:complete len:105 (+) Transcript_19185:1-315(+)